MRAAGASIRGPLHRSTGASCEDCWLAHSDARGTVLAVADGLGSRPQARLGARAAVRAVRQAWRHWSLSPRGKAEDLVRLVEVLWRIALGEIEPNDAATTCLVCAVPRDRDGVLAQLGDGLVGTLRSGEFSALVAPREGFGTETHALGVPHGMRDWTLAPLSALGEGDAVLLATDGVSDDLLADRCGAFVRWMVDDLQSAPRAGTRIAAKLRAWPVPRHLDDKTVLLAWTEDE